MLSHKLLATTVKAYLGDGTERAIEAQNTFTSITHANDNIIDIEVEDEDSEFQALKKIYPSSSAEKIQKIIDMMK